MGNLVRRYPAGVQAPQDPKLKIPDVASVGAKAAAERTVSTGEVTALRKELAQTRAKVDEAWAAILVLQTYVVALQRAQTPDFGTGALMHAEIEKASREGGARETLASKPSTGETVARVTRKRGNAGNAAVSGNAPKLSPAAKQKTYRERQKVKTK